MEASWSHLPIELRQIIGAYLSATDLVNLSKVNKASYRQLTQVRRAFDAYARENNFEPIELASKYGLVPIVKDIFDSETLFEPYVLDRAFDLAAENGHINVLNLFDQRGYADKIITTENDFEDIDEIAINSVIKNLELYNRDQVIDWLLAHGVKINFSQLSVAAEVNDNELIEQFNRILRDQGNSESRLIDTIIYGAIYGGQLDLLNEYIQDIELDIELDKANIKAMVGQAIAGDRANVIDWLIKNKLTSIDQLPIYDIVHQGKINIVEWITQQRIILPDDLVAVAINQGKIKVADMLVKYGLKLGPDDIDITNLIQSGRLKTLKWLHQHGVEPESSGLRYALDADLPKIIAWMLSIGIQPEQDFASAVVAADNLDVLKLLYNYNKLIDRTLLNRALDKDQLDIADWLFNHGFQASDMEKLIPELIKRGRLASLKWLYNHEIDFTEDDLALAESNADIYNWIYDTIKNRRNSMESDEDETGMMLETD